MLSDCTLWTDPEATVAKGLRRVFELVETYAKQSHWWRYLLKCRECGQLYFYEFYEEIDWDDGKHPQFTTFIPVGNEAEAHHISQTPRGQLSAFVPRLCKDWPKEESKPKLHWVTGPDAVS